MSAADDAEPTAPAEAPPPPARKLTYKAPAHNLLTGVAGTAELNTTVAFTVDLGMGPLRIGEGQYRMGGDQSDIAKLREMIDLYGFGDTVKVDFERPPQATRVSFKAPPDRRRPVRMAEIHGIDHHAQLVAGAVDAGLNVVCVGLRRYEVFGTTGRLVQWLAACTGTTVAKALELLGITAEQAAAEDAASDLPTITVNLPKRETISVIVRDREGDITEVTQTERTIQ